ncbi:hypothetical protein [Reticulibacter mediterranei]|nr:hypothetical protein [Reticulibacter mediterranei]
MVAVLLCYEHQVLPDHFRLSGSWAYLSKVVAVQVLVLGTALPGPHVIVAVMIPVVLVNLPSPLPQAYVLPIDSLDLLNLPADLNVLVRSDRQGEVYSDLPVLTDYR